MIQMEELLAQLKGRGCRMTAVRLAMVRLFAKTSKPLAAEEILKKIAVSERDVNKTTIYREIAFLEEAGIVQKVEFGDQIRRYELKEQEHHHHVVCEGCGRVEDVQADEDIAEHEKDITRQSGFKITSHALEFFGLCPSCQ